MDAYSPPVAQLLTLGRPKARVGDGDDPPYALGPEHIPELIRLMRDGEIARSEAPEWYAEVHAWRALGELRATEAFEPLLEMLAGQTDDSADWSDWITEEVPRVLGLIVPRPRMIPA